MAALVLVVPALVTAQQSPPPKPPADTSAKASASAARDTLPARDTATVDSVTARRKRLLADSIKAPIAVSERPVGSDALYHWSGEQLRAAGAVTLADLLARIPGATSFRANWIPAPQFIAWNGDVGRVRVILDGVELDGIDPRMPGVLDLAAMPLWQVEEVSVERAPGELRVHLRSWREDHVSPMTRTDITSGSEGTNLYRGFYGKRLHNGGAIQAAAQQYSTISPRTGGDGSSLQVFSRVGWASKRWSVDAVVNRVSMDRDATDRFVNVPSATVVGGTPKYKGAMTTGYARLAWGNPDATAAPWAQLIAASQSMAENHKESSVIGLAPSAAVKDTVDSTAARVQYVLAAGASRWGVRASVGARLRLVNLTRWEHPVVKTRHVSTAGDTTFSMDTLDVSVGETRADVSPTIRLAYQRGWASMSAYAESRGSDSTRRADVNVRLTPWRWLDAEGAYGSYTPKSAVTGGPAFTGYRVEFGTRLWGRRLSAGVISRGLTTVAAPRVLDSTLARAATGEERALLVGSRGPIYQSLGYDLSVVRWGSSGVYRPQMEVLSRLIFETGLLRRFPQGNFHMLAEAWHQHRTPMFFPTPTGGKGWTTAPTDVINARLEIRIASGTAFIQFRNLTGKLHDTAPGYIMPRQQQFYGLRWNFMN